MGHTPGMLLAQNRQSVRVRSGSNQVAIHPGTGMALGRTPSQNECRGGAGVVAPGGGRASDSGSGAALRAVARRSGLGDGVEDGGELGREGLVGVFEEEGDLPHLGRAEDVLVGGHAGETDAVADLPEGLAGLIVRDADDATVAVGLPELGDGGVHGFGELARLFGGAVAAGALGGVDMGAGEDVGGGGLDGWLGELAVDSGGERDVDDLAFEGEGAIGDGDGRVAEAKVGVEAGDGDEGGERDAEKEGEDG